MTEDEKRERERQKLLNQLERTNVNERKAPVTVSTKEMCLGEPVNVAAMRQLKTHVQHATHLLKV